ncbi:hypothetical protein LTV02_06920 [Nocardia yamanashiensis]|uniref:hypothetical protein n=1 Tax=Nocardia yamanashiensis TaxID=209247 RepID=UPI001E35EDFF|nr:hypothetical protein [Nocardia yamanashiensis]UGT43116.1 hypothetical protein LTV02_06920 [Nocardia yamanashiensis]
MIRLRRRRRSLAIWSALMMAAAALVGVTMPASAASENGTFFVYGDYLVHDTTTVVCAGHAREAVSAPVLA